jgi:hypothetical protein
MSASASVGPGAVVQFLGGGGVWVTMTASADDTLAITGATGQTVTITDVAISAPYAAKTTTYTITASDHVIGADSSSAAFTLTLPAASTVSGRTFKVVDVGGAAGSKNITIARAGADSINGSSTSVVLNGDHDSVVLFSDGSNWYARGAD